MAIDTSEARLKFLRQAAYQLAMSTPAVSAALSSSYHKSVIDKQDDLQQAKKEWDTQRRESCGACGSIMLPGLSSSMDHHSSLASTRKARSKTSGLTKQSKQIVSTCLRCDRKSVQHLQARPPKHINLKSRHKIIDTPKIAGPAKQDGEGQDKVAKSANATSKQRQKSRKGGLQAMLEKNKKQSSGQGSLGLDLMDFMQ